jgi:hypothetical protein
MSKIVNGARAKILVDDVVVGIFDSVSFSVNLGNEDVFILGSHRSQETSITSYEPIPVQCSAFRIVNEGVHKLPKFPKLQDLLNLGTIKLDIVDRETGVVTETIMQCTPIAYSGGHNAKVNSRTQISYKGLYMQVDGEAQAEVNAVTLP